MFSFRILLNMIFVVIVLLFLPKYSEAECCRPTVQPYCTVEDIKKAGSFLSVIIIKIESLVNSISVFFNELFL